MNPHVQSCTQARPVQVWFVVLAWVEESSQAPKVLSTLLSDQGEAEVCQNPRCWTAPSPRKGLLEENGRGGVVPSLRKA